MIDTGFKRRMAELALRRQILLVQSAATRQQAVGAINELAPAAARIDLVITVVRYLKQHPLLTAIALGAAARFLHRGVLRGAASITRELANRLFR